MKFKYVIIEHEDSITEKLQRCFEEFNEYTCIGAEGCFDRSLDLQLVAYRNIQQ